MRANTQRTSFFASRRSAGFTLIELLTVIAIIGILAAILIPTVSKVRQSANDNRTRAQFSQWTTAIQSFKEEYGYWPDFNATRPDWEYTEPTEDGSLIVRLNDEPEQRRNFVEFLSGRMMNGETYREGGGPAYSNHPNRRGIEFYSFSENDYKMRDPDGDIHDPQNVFPVDAYDNSDIIIIMDHDGNGIITLRDDANHQVQPGFPPDILEYRATPLDAGQSEQQIRAGVVIYSPGKTGNSDDEVRENIVTSW